MVEAHKIERIIMRIPYLLLNLLLFYEFFIVMSLAFVLFCEFLLLFITTTSPLIQLLAGSLIKGLVFLRGVI